MTELSTTIMSSASEFPSDVTPFSAVSSFTDLHALWIQKGTRSSWDGERRSRASVSGSRRHNACHRFNEGCCLSSMANCTYAHICSKVTDMSLVTVTRSWIIGCTTHVMLGTLSGTAYSLFTWPLLSSQRSLHHFLHLLITNAITKSH